MNIALKIYVFVLAYFNNILQLFNKFAYNHQKIMCRGNPALYFEYLVYTSASANFIEIFPSAMANYTNIV